MRHTRPGCLGLCLYWWIIEEKTDGGSVPAVADFPSDTPQGTLIAPHMNLRAVFLSASSGSTDQDFSVFSPSACTRRAAAWLCRVMRQLLCSGWR